MIPEKDDQLGDDKDSLFSGYGWWWGGACSLNDSKWPQSRFAEPLCIQTSRAAIELSSYSEHLNYGVAAWVSAASQHIFASFLLVIMEKNLYAHSRKTAGYKNEESKEFDHPWVDRQIFTLSMEWSWG